MQARRDDLSGGPAALDALFRKVDRRLLPFFGLCYLAAYIDRVNVGFAKLEMARDLALSDVAYGFGAGIFFIGYFLFEVPSNLVLHRVGARRWLARIMVSWAIVSAAGALLAPVQAIAGDRAAAFAFYLIRFLLGAAEAGFFPGVLLYLTAWYPPSRRSLALGKFIVAQPVAFVLGAPLSGLILATCQGLAGLQGWQWLYVLEAAPAALLGLWLYRRLDDTVADAAWLTPAERMAIAGAQQAERPAAPSADIPRLFRDGRIRLLALAYFLLVLGAYGLNFWLPSIVKAAGATGDLSVGLLTAIPYAVGIAIMLPLAARARNVERACRAAAWMCALAGFGLAASARADDLLWPTMAGMTLGITGYLSANVLFWRLPGEAYEGRALAVATAAVNALGNLGGFVGPYLVGAVVAHGGGTPVALLVLAAALAAAGAVLLVVHRRGSKRERAMRGTAPVLETQSGGDVR